MADKKMRAIPTTPTKRELPEINFSASGKSGKQISPDQVDSEIG